MNKKIEIDGQEVEFEANAGTTILYKRAFGSDLMTFISNATNDKADAEMLDVVPQLAFIMNLQATSKGKMSELMKKATEDNFFDWLCGFSGGAFMDADVIKEIIELWLKTNKTTSKSKN